MFIPKSSNLNQWLRDALAEGVEEGVVLGQRPHVLGGREEVPLQHVGVPEAGAQGRDGRGVERGAVVPDLKVGKGLEWNVLMDQFIHTYVVWMVESFWQNS